jgi:hypothetical protein
MSTLDDYNNFKPMNEDERRFVEVYNHISNNISKKIKGLSEEKRLPYLRASEPHDLALMNLYLQALKNEDYETCAPAKALLVERGFKIPS